MQSKKTCCHMELFRVMATLEHLGQKFFRTYEDVSKGTGNRHRSDLNVREMNVCVRDPGFTFRGDNDFVSKYKNMTEMRTTPVIQIARRIAFRQLGKRLCASDRRLFVVFTLTNRLLAYLTSTLSWEYLCQ